MSHGYIDADLVSNGSGNRAFSDVLDARLSRRQLLQGAVAATLAGLLPFGGTASAAARSPVGLGFKGVPISRVDTVVVPEGYSSRVLFAWGDPIGHVSGSPAFKPDASNTAAEQALQAGMHHDGIHYFPLPYGSNSSTRGLLAMNHEYTDDGLLHPDGLSNWSREKVLKSQNASGVAVIEIDLQGAQWSVVRPSKYARRITGNTPIAIAGPAAGHALMKTAFNPAGDEALGTINTCAHGHTPWGTYLACEENWDSYFINSGEMLRDHQRNGIAPKGRGYRWEEFDERFDAGKHPNEPNRFGWVVEIDPFDAQSKPVKRTALGRTAHEGAWYAPAQDGRAVVYLGDDRQFEYIYKFVSRDRMNHTDRAANRRLLDEGTLYVARFHDDGSGEWIPLRHGYGKLNADNGFADQGEVLIKTRAAADILGATKMDRPEWVAVHPKSNEVYCTLTNNVRRGAPQAPGLSAPNPRANNVFGHIIRWREEGNDPASLKFNWDIFVMAGDPRHEDEKMRGNIKGDAFGSPDGLWFDTRGVLWIQTDVSTSVLNSGNYANLGNNQMLAADTVTGEIRRFLTGPNGSEVTGVVTTPDGSSMFVNIQHPGETSSERNDPKTPQAVSTWPDGPSGGRPRAATIAIRKSDGGIVGT